MPLLDRWLGALWSLGAGAAAGCRCQMCGWVRFGGALGAGAAEGAAECRCSALPTKVFLLPGVYAGGRIIYYSHQAFQGERIVLFLFPLTCMIDLGGDITIIWCLKPMFGFSCFLRPNSIAHGFSRTMTLSPARGSSRYQFGTLQSIHQSILNHFNLISKLIKSD